MPAPDSPSCAGSNRPPSSNVPRPGWAALASSLADPPPPGIGRPPGKPSPASLKGTARPRPPVRGLDSPEEGGAAPPGQVRATSPPPAPRSSAAAEPRSPSRLRKEDGGQGGRQSSARDPGSCTGTSVPSCGAASSRQDGRGAGPKLQPFPLPVRTPRPLAGVLPAGRTGPEEVRRAAQAHWCPGGSGADAGAADVTVAKTAPGPAPWQPEANGKRLYGCSATCGVKMAATGERTTASLQPLRPSPRRPPRDGTSRVPRLELGRSGGQRWYFCGRASAAVGGSAGGVEAAGSWPTRPVRWVGRAEVRLGQGERAV